MPNWMLVIGLFALPMVIGSFIWIMISVSRLIVDIVGRLKSWYGRTFRGKVTGSRREPTF